MPLLHSSVWSYWVFIICRVLPNLVVAGVPRQRERPRCSPRPWRLPTPPCGSSTPAWSPVGPACHQASPLATATLAKPAPVLLLQDDRQRRCLNGVTLSSTCRRGAQDTLWLKRLIISMSPSGDQGLLLKELSLVKELPKTVDW